MRQVRSGVLVIAIVSCLASLTGLGLDSTPASASVASLRASEAGYCAERATGPVSDHLKVAVCADLVSDLVGIAQLLGLPVLAPTSIGVTNPVKVLFVDGPDPEAPLAYLDTKYFYNGANFEPCQVTIFASGSALATLDGEVTPALNVLLAHEAVHCYQNSVITFEESGGNNDTLVPMWMSEGLATYVATFYAKGEEPGTSTFWIHYGWLGIPNKELLRRSYDAVGWYSMVARATGNDLMTKIVPAWRAWVSGGEDAFIKALGGDEPAVEAAWAPSLLHAPQWGDAWNTPGIGVPPGAQPTTVNDTIAAEDVPFSVQIAPYAAIVDKETTVADGLVEVSIDNGFASVHDLGTADALDFGDQLFCIGTACDDTKLTCPGSPKEVKPIPLTVPSYVAAGGSTQLGTLILENISAPTTASTPMQLPKAAGPCTFPGTLPLPKAGFSEGEPHIQTLSGGSYDFQGAGEYTLVRSASGDVDVQVRAVPFDYSPSVTFNTAVAMRVVSTDVEVDAGHSPVLLIDGKRIPSSFSGLRKLTGGGQLKETNNGSSVDIDVTWPDGSEVDVYATAIGENATFVPPAPGLDQFSGLLAALPVRTGQKNARTQTFIGGDGHRYAIDPTSPVGFKVLYGPFAASWRVTKETSLFTYPRGKSPASFVKKGFPARLVSASRLPADKRRRAEATCKAAGVSGSTLLDDCEVDVVETGQKTFATATSRIQAGVQPGGSSTPKAPTVAGSGHPASYYFTHQCAAVSLAQIRQIVGPTDSMSVYGGNSCGFRPDSASEIDSIAFSHQSARLFASTTPGKAGSGAVPALGDDAYCIVHPSSSDQSYVVDSLGNAGSIQILAANCAQATALTKDALSRISGL
jgi:hypothetical protein